MSIKYKDCLKDNNFELFFDGSRIYDTVLVENGNHTLIFNEFDLWLLGGEGFV